MCKTMDNLFFFNKVAELRNNPTFKNLLELAKEDAIKADFEINDFAGLIAPTLSSRENVLWLMAYLQGMCSRSFQASQKAAVEELQNRVNQYYQSGNWLFRKPYQPVPKVEIPQGPEGPNLA